MGNRTGRPNEADCPGGGVTLVLRVAACSLAGTAAFFAVVYWLLGHTNDTLTHVLIPGD